MVPYDHQVADLVVEIDAAGGIGDEQVFDSDDFHDADRQGDEFHAVPFIIVDAPLHGDDGFPADFSDDEVPLVADGRRDRESGDVPVGNGDGVDDLVGQPSQSASQDDADGWMQVKIRQDAVDIGSSLVNPFCSRVHDILF